MQTQQEKDHFLQLILQNQAIIFKICHSYCSNPADRQDLVQEIIYQLWRSGHRFNPDYKFTTWMYRVALNVAISFHRQEKKRIAIISPAHPATDMEDPLPGTSPQQERASVLHHHISQLNELDRALILLYFEEKTYPEMAEILGITTTNVATRLSRTKSRLKDAIHKHQIN